MTQPLRLVHDTAATIPQDTPDLFDLFWSMYPRKVSKGAARRAWKGAADKADPDTILASAYEYASSPYVKDKLKEGYVPYPATWLNGERWCDDRREWGIEPHRVAPQATVSEDQVSSAVERLTENTALLRKVAGMWRSCTGQREKWDDGRYLADRTFLTFAALKGLKWAGA